MKEHLIEIWGDVVDSKELLLSIIIITITTMGVYLLSPEASRTTGLFFGLGGAVIGFLITVFLFKPKRKVTQEGEHD